jgi:hypothetical protein
MTRAISGLIVAAATGGWHRCFNLPDSFTDH